MFSMVTCAKCNVIFNTTDAQRLQLQQIYSCNGKMAMLKCPECKKTFPFVLSEHKSVESQDVAIPFLCPSAHCGGWVSCVTPEEGATPFYGCGECGRTWRDMASLQLDIATSIEQYPYRNAAYRYVETTGWQPLEYKEIPPGLHKNIESEPWPSEVKARKKKK